MASLSTLRFQNIVIAGLAWLGWVFCGVAGLASAGEGSPVDVKIQMVWPEQVEPAAVTVCLFEKIDGRMQRAYVTRSRKDRAHFEKVQPGRYQIRIVESSAVKTSVDLDQLIAVVPRNSPQSLTVKLQSIQVVKLPVKVHWPEGVEPGAKGKLRWSRRDGDVRVLTVGQEPADMRAVAGGVYQWQFTPNIGGASPSRGTIKVDAAATADQGLVVEARIKQPDLLITCVIELADEGYLGEPNQLIVRGWRLDERREAAADFKIVRLAEASVFEQDPQTKQYAIELPVYDLKAGAYRVVATIGNVARQRALVAEEQGVRITPDEAIEQTLRLSKPKLSRLVVHVALDDKQWAKGADVLVDGPGPFVARTKTNDRGEAVFPALWHGTYSVAASTPAHPIRSKSITLAKANEQVRLDLGNVVELAIRVVDAQESTDAGEVTIIPALDISRKRALSSAKVVDGIHRIRVYPDFFPCLVLAETRHGAAAKLIARSPAQDDPIDIAIDPKPKRELIIAVPNAWLNRPVEYMTVWMCPKGSIEPAAIMRVPRQSFSPAKGRAIGYSRALGDGAYRILVRLTDTAKTFCDLGQVTLNEDQTSLEIDVPKEVPSGQTLKQLHKPSP